MSQYIYIYKLLLKSKKMAKDLSRKGSQPLMSGVKVVTVGDGAVGKTSMLVSAVTGNFPREYIPTVFDNHEMDRIVDGHPEHLILYDTAGQEEYESLRLLSYTDTHVFLLVFSVESTSSFENIETKWLKEVREHRPNSPFIVIGAKCDLREDDGVIAEVASLGRPMRSKEEYERKAMEWGASKYFECSASRMVNLDLILDEAVRIGKKSRDEEQAKATAQTKAASGDGGGCCVIS